MYTIHYSVPTLLVHKVKIEGRKKKKPIKPPTHVSVAGAKKQREAFPRICGIQCSLHRTTGITHASRRARSRSKELRESVQSRQSAAACFPFRLSSIARRSRPREVVGVVLLLSSLHAVDDRGGMAPAARVLFLSLTFLCAAAAGSPASIPGDESESCQPDKLTVYKVVLHTFWSRDKFPKHYPDWRPPAQWSKLFGELTHYLLPLSYFKPSS